MIARGVARFPVFFRHQQPLFPPLSSQLTDPGHFVFAQNDVVTRLRRFGAADNRSYDDSKLYQHESTNRDIHGRKCTCLKCLQADTGGDVVRLGTEDNLYFGPQWK